MRISEELRERTKQFAARVIRLFVALPKTQLEVAILGKQLLRSGTSVAAHAREASRARSEAELCSKLDGLLQEADESQLWIELLIEECHLNHPDLRPLHQEGSEIIAIFTTIVSKVRRNQTEPLKR